MSFCFLCFIVFCVRLLCCVHDYGHLHHHHHHHIPVGIRSKRSLRPPRKYNPKPHFPVCTCSSASFIIPSFPSSHTGSLSQSESTPPVPRCTRSSWTHADAFCLSAHCLCYLDRWSPFSGFTQLVSNVAANVSEVLHVKSPTDEEAQM